MSTKDSFNTFANHFYTLFLDTTQVHTLVCARKRTFAELFCKLVALGRRIYTHWKKNGKRSTQIRSVVKSTDQTHNCRQIIEKFRNRGCCAERLDPQL